MPQGNTIKRPPIVVVMGHVNHGKTTLLDYIRKTSVAAKESGGITQHIGAYEVTHSGKKITFLDTPGHEAFSKMRSRGAKVADIAILVVAADEGVKPQTKEAIRHIQEAELPFLAALNKIDKPNADVERVKQELATAGVLVEGWGGNVPVAAISAKTGTGVDALLDLILLMADLEELAADPTMPAEGVVIESELDRRRGPVATLLVQNGTLKKGDSVIAGAAVAKVKLLENFAGQPVDAIGPSSPARVLGWEARPQVGEQFRTGARAELRELGREMEAKLRMAEIRTGDLLLIIKADVGGSREALAEAVEKIPHEGVELVILDSGVGDISESDVKLAYASHALILGFRVKISREAELFLKQNPVRILESDVIYELIELVTKEIARIADEKKKRETFGRLEVLALFGAKGIRQTIGGRVTEGSLKKRMLVSVIRKQMTIGKGKIVNLQKEKHDAEEVAAGEECGILFESEIQIAKGDMLEEIKNAEA